MQTLLQLDEQDRSVSLPGIRSGMRLYIIRTMFLCKKLMFRGWLRRRP